MRTKMSANKIKMLQIQYTIGSCLFLNVDNLHKRIISVYCGPIAYILYTNYANQYMGVNERKTSGFNISLLIDEKGQNLSSYDLA